MKSKFEQILNLLFNMIFSIKFIGAVVATVYFYLSRDLVSMATVAIAYVGIKAVIDASLAWKTNGEYEFEFVSDQKVNSILCWIISTRTWVALLSAILCYKGMVLGIFPVDGALEQIRNIGIAYGGAIGFPEVAGFLKTANLDFLKPKPKPVPQSSFLQDYPPPAVIQPVQPVPVLPPEPPPEVPFSDADKGKLLAISTAMAKASKTTTSALGGTVAPEPSQEEIFYQMLKYSLDTFSFPALNINRVCDGIGFILQFGKEAYFERAHHTYGEARNHLADTNNTCPYSTVMQYARAEGFEKVMREVDTIEERLLFVEWAIGKGIDLISTAPYAYQSILGIGIVAGDVSRQSRNKS